MGKEIEGLRTQVDKNEAVVRELVAIIQSELSTKLKATVKISMWEMKDLIIILVN